MDTTLLYASSGVNRSQFCVSWRHDLVLHGSNHAISVLKFKSDCLSTVQTVHTSEGHNGRVNCVRWINDRQFVSSASDGTIVLWSKDGVKFQMASAFKGHTDTVTVVDGINHDGDLILASCSGDSTMRIWRGQECIQTETFPGGGFSLNVRMVTFKSKLLLFVAMHDCRLDIYYFDQGKFIKCDSLGGHEDWAQAIDVFLHNDHLLVASGGQDNYVRVWRLEEHVRQETSDGELTVKKQIFEIVGGTKLSATIETILSGHEDRVTGLHWNIRDHNPFLLSCSMDKTMILWRPSDEDDGVWTDSVRVGEVGGNTLGFLGCQIGLGGDGIIGYSFNGALHLWTLVEEDWKSQLTPKGHFGEVEDISWESNGKYLVSTSSDQTTRIHAPWSFTNGSRDRSEMWYEIARPQVHGHDLTCITTLAGGRLASGAEEKVIRVFDAPKKFLFNFGKISGQPIERSHQNCGDQVAQGASVPSLGLSNKPVIYDELEGFKARPDNEKERHVKDKFPDFYFVPEDHDRPPPEESLIQNTLWPEVKKLYGHGNEIYAIAANREGTLLATSCRATKPEQADVIVWDAKNEWGIVQRLPGHGLTVTQLEFSPDGKYLLTVSRDRSWCLFEQLEREFSLVATTDKSSNVHQRLLWCCGWDQSSKYFATGSRDKKLAVWQVEAKGEPRVILACKTPMSFEAAVTAVTFFPHSSDFLAVGLENGNIYLVSLDLKANENQWKVLNAFDESLSHHGMVKRLRFRPTERENSFILASCSTDHFVKLYNITLT